MTRNLDAIAALALVLVGVVLAWRRLPRQAALALPAVLMGGLGAGDLAAAFDLEWASSQQDWLEAALHGGALPLLAWQLGWPRSVVAKDGRLALLLLASGTLLATLPDHGWWAQLLAAVAGLTMAVRVPLRCGAVGVLGVLVLWFGLVAEAIGRQLWLGIDELALRDVALVGMLLLLQPCLPASVRSRHPR